MAEASSLRHARLYQWVRDNQCKVAALNGRADVPPSCLLLGE